MSLALSPLLHPTMTYCPWRCTSLWSLGRRDGIHSLLLWFLINRTRVLLFRPLIYFSKWRLAHLVLEKNVSHSIQSSYKLFMVKVANGGHLKVEGEWDLIWRLKFHPRVKLFVWRALRDCLPARIWLRTKNIDYLSTCVQCNSDLENYWHVFLTCPVSLQYWNEAGFH